MHYEQTILVLGCEPSAEQILLAALIKAGFKARGANYADIIRSDQAPSCVLIHLDSTENERALRFMTQSSLLRARRVIIIDPDDPRARQFCADADIDDMIFKPIHLREMLTRLSYALERDALTLKREITLHDEQGFVQKLRSLADSVFSGVLVLEGRGREAKVYFEHGRVVGVQFGKKIQKMAVSALWRLFPAAHRAIAGVSVPPSVALNALDLDIESLIQQVTQTASFFREKFADISGISSVFRVNGAVYDERFETLPHQVRRIVQLFDGVRSLENLLDVLELDEIVIIQVIRRLIDEHLVIECQAADSLGVSLDDWIMGLEGATQKVARKQVMSSPRSASSSLREDLSTVTRYLEELKALEEKLASIPEDHEVTKTAKREITRRQETSEVCVHSRIHRDTSRPRQGFSEAELRDLLDEMPKPTTTMPTALPFEREFVENRLKKAGIEVITAETRMHKDEVYSEIFLDQEAQEDELRAANAPVPVEPPPESPEERTAREQREAEAELEAAMQWFKDEKNRSQSHPSMPAIVAPIAEKQQPKVPDTQAPVSSSSSKTRRSPKVTSPKDEVTVITKKPEKQSWAMKQYLRRHRKELDPEIWKAQTLARLDAEAAERDRKLKIIFCIIGILLVLCIIVLIYKSTDASETETTPQHLTTEETSQVAQAAEATTNAQNTVESGSQPSPSVPVEAQLNPDVVVEDEDMLEGLPSEDVVPTAAMDMPQRRHRHVRNLDLAPQIAEITPSSADLVHPKAVIYPSNDKDDSGALQANTRKSRKAQVQAVSLSPKAQLRAVREAMLAKDLDQAEALLQPLLEMKPINPHAFIAAAEIAAQRADFDKAVKYYVQVEPSQVKRVAYWKKRASLHRAAGQMAEADAALDRAIALVGADTPEGKALNTMKANPM